MIYDEPRFRPGGDRFLEIEFGDELNLELNFRAQGLGQALTRERIKGVIEIAPFFASALVHYDPDLVTFDDLKTELLRLINAVASASDVELQSRLIYMPAMYLDPWSADAIDQYIEKINPAKERDPDFVARITHSHERGHHRLGRAAGHHELAVRIHGPPREPRDLRAQGRA